MSKRIFKYPTGAEVPKGAVYLNTVTQTWEYTNVMPVGKGWSRCWYVWHYFLVEVEDGDD